MFHSNVSQDAVVPEFPVVPAAPASVFDKFLATMSPSAHSLGSGVLITPEVVLNTVEAPVDVYRHETD